MSKMMNNINMPVMNKKHWAADSAMVSECKSK